MEFSFRYDGGLVSMLEKAFVKLRETTDVTNSLLEKLNGSIPGFITHVSNSQMLNEDCFGQSDYLINDEILSISFPWRYKGSFSLSSSRKIPLIYVRKLITKLIGKMGGRLEEYCKMTSYSSEPTLNSSPAFFV